MWCALGAGGRRELSMCGWASCALRWAPTPRAPWPAFSSAADGSSRTFLQTLLDDIRVARAGKASSDYRRRRDADCTAAAAAAASSASASAGPSSASTAADASRGQAPTSTANGAAAAAAGAGDVATTPNPAAQLSPPSSPAQDADLLLHPSRARGDLNAYTGGPRAAVAAAPHHHPGRSVHSPQPSPPPPQPPPPLTWQEDEMDVEDLSGWRPVTYGESGIEAMVERRIRDSVARGELDNLRGRGQPLEALGPKHDAQFYRIDPLMAALTRSMGAQAIKPRSLELRDELTEARREFEQAVAAEARRWRRRARLGRQQAAGPPPRGASGAAPVASGGDDRQSSSGGSGSGVRREEARRVGEELAAADLPGLAYRFEQVTLLRAQYNGAVLADKETYGAGWPLEQLRRLEYGQEVAAAAEAALGEADTGADTGADAGTGT